MSSVKELSIMNYYNLVSRNSRECKYLLSMTIIKENYVVSLEIVYVNVVEGIEYYVSKKIDSVMTDDSS